METALHLTLLVPAVGALVASWATYWTGWAYFQGAGPDPGSAEGNVTAIVPLRGTSPNTKRHLEALLGQEVPGALEVIIAVEKRSDPAARLASDLRERYDRLRVVYSEERGAPGTGKLKNLIAGTWAARHEHLVFVDGDAHLRLGALRRALAFLSEPEVGLAFAAPVSGEAEGLPSAFESMVINDGAMLYASQAYREELRGVVGTFMATRLGVLEEIGGLGALADRIVGIDVAIGQAVADAGFQLRLLRRPVRVGVGSQPWSRVLRRLHRWLVTIRQHAPGFPALAIGLSLPLTWTLLYLGVAAVRGAGAAVGLGTLGLVWAWKIGSQALTSLQLARTKGLWPRLWIAPVAELIWLGVFVWSVATDRVRWAGRTIEVHPRGRGEVIEERPAQHRSAR